MKSSQLAFIFCLIAITVQGSLPPVNLAQVRATIDPDIPPYIAQDSVSGRLSISAPETMKPLVEAWTGDLIRQHPDLIVTVIREDPKSGLAALLVLERRAEIAAMSRRITPTEIAEFILEYGYVPMEVPVARHASTVFVQNDNRKAEAFHPQFPEAHGLASVMFDESRNQHGIGLSPTDHRNSMAKPVSTASLIDNRYANPLIPSKVDRLHPVRRNLYLYITSPPRSNPTPATAELVHYALCRQGQELVLYLGYSPLSYAEIARVSSKWLACCKIP
jgi:ABC-type phosphate transport system substrate-binding protein